MSDKHKVHVVTVPAEVLSTVATDVDFDDQVQVGNCRLIADKMQEALTERKGAVGIAAPQIDYGKRIIRIQHDTTELTLFNPEIIRTWGGLRNSNEKCLSVPDKEVKRLRNTFIEVQYRDINGAPLKRKFKQFHACIIQHEIDHLNGITIADG